LQCCVRENKNKEREREEERKRKENIICEVHGGPHIKQIKNLNAL